MARQFTTTCFARETASGSHEADWLPANGTLSRRSVQFDDEHISTAVTFPRAAPGIFLIAEAPFPIRREHIESSIGGHVAPWRRPKTRPRPGIVVQRGGGSIMCKPPHLRGSACRYAHDLTVIGRGDLEQRIRLHVLRPVPLPMAVVERSAHRHGVRGVCVVP